MIWFLISEDVQQGHIFTVFVAIFSANLTSCSTMSIVGAYSVMSFSSCMRENTST